MLNAAIAQPLTLPSGPDPSATAQKVVIVNGSPEILGLLETVLDGGQYDVVFAESRAHAYSQIKRVHPDLVILFVRMDDMDGLQVLSMLKLDAETRAIPVLTYTNDYETDIDDDEDTPDFPGTDLFTPKPVELMN
ncbi:MAG: response regulator [Acidobacteriota bacterium]